MTGVLRGETGGAVNRQSLGESQVHPKPERLGPLQEPMHGKGKATGRKSGHQGLQVGDASTRDTGDGPFWGDGPTVFLDCGGGYTARSSHSKE